MPNFVKISQSVAKVLRFFDFSRWRPSLYHSAKFGYDRYSSFYNMNSSIFGTFGWKIPIHAPKIVFWAI